MLKNKNFFFRFNFDEKIGFGHLARCLKIADKLDFNSKFIVDKNNNYDFTKKLNYKIHYLYNSKSFFNELEDAKKVYNIVKKSNFPVIFVDDYRVGSVWLDYFKKKNMKLVVLDDLLNRNLNCDLYINYKLDSTDEHKKNWIILLKKKNKEIIRTKIFNNR